MIENSILQKDYPAPPAAQLISHLSEATYTSFPKAIKELIINAFDAGAKTVHLNFSEDFSTLQIIDDGKGMSAEQFKNDFLRISGSWKGFLSPGTRDKETGRPIIGRYGIGVLAIAPICEWADIKIKQKGVTTGIYRRVPLKHLFNKKIQNNSLKSHYYFNRLPDFKDDIEKSYTEIILYNLREDIRKELRRPRMKTKWDSVEQLSGLEIFKWYLGLLLPIRYKKGFPVFGANEDVIRKIKREIRSFNFRVFINKVELLKPICLAKHSYKECKWNYEKEIVPKSHYNVFEVYSEKGSLVKFWGYFYNQSKQILPTNLRGLLVHVNFVGVQGYDQSLLRYTRNIGPILYAISGEIFVESGLEAALTIDKDDFKVDHPAFKDFVSQIHRKIDYVAEESKRRSRRIHGRKVSTQKLVKDLSFEPISKITLELKKEWKEVFPFRKSDSLRLVIDTLKSRIERLEKIGISLEEREYLSEGIRCFHSECYRASIIMCWSAGIHRMHLKISTVGFNRFFDVLDDIVKKKVFPWFTKVPHRCDNIDEFKEKVNDKATCVGLYGMNLITRPQLKALIGFLQKRNDCAHPSGYSPTDGEAIGCFTFILKMIIENPTFR